MVLKTLPLLLIIVIGIIIRLSNLSPFLLYPDSYQNLIISENLTHYHSVVGYLGEQGTIYPPFFMWARFGYPLLIILLNFFKLSMTESASLISYSIGILTIPLVFLLTKKMTKDNLTPILTTGLIALSFNHIVWGGFILTETTGVFLLILIIYLLMRKSTGLTPVLLGSVFTASIVTRFEYLILLPIILLFLFMQKWQLKELGIFIGTFLLSSFLLFTTFFPTEDLVNIMLTQLSNIGLKISVFLLTVGVIMTLYKKLSNDHKKTAKRYFLLTFFTICLVLAILSFASLLFPSLSSFTKQLGGLLDFIRHDFLIIIAFLYGQYVIIRKKPEHSNLLFFTNISLFSLYIVYYMINPLMERYMTHLIPFLLVVGVYGIIDLTHFLKDKKIKLKRKRIIATGAIVLLLLQGTISFQGIKAWAQGSYFETSYEMEAAKKAVTLAEGKKAILVTSFPEPYFLVTHQSVISISDKKPFIYPDRIKDEDQLIIIQDAGMRDIFPNFSRFLDRSFQSQKITEFYVKRSYHYTDKTTLERLPVVVYSTTLKDLQDRISSTE